MGVYKMVSGSQHIFHDDTLNKIKINRETLIYRLLMNF